MKFDEDLNLRMREDSVFHAARGIMAAERCVATEGEVEDYCATHQKIVVQGICDHALEVASVALESSAWSLVWEALSWSRTETAESIANAMDLLDYGVTEAYFMDLDEDE